MALPIWALYIKKIYADSTLNISQEDFEKPLKELTVEIDCEKFNAINSNNIFDSEEQF